MLGNSTQHQAQHQTREMTTMMMNHQSIVSCCKTLLYLYNGRGRTGFPPVSFPEWTLNVTLRHFHFPECSGGNAAAAPLAYYRDDYYSMPAGMMMMLHANQTGNTVVNPASAFNAVNASAAANHHLSSVAPLISRLNRICPQVIHSAAAFKFTSSSIILLLLHVLTGCFGLFGNLCVILCVLFFKHMRCSPAHILLLNLAINDLLVFLLVQPWNLLNQFRSNWRFGRVICKLYPWFFGTTICVGILILIAISLERYVMIVAGSNGGFAFRKTSGNSINKLTPQNRVHLFKSSNWFIRHTRSVLMRPGLIWLIVVLIWIVCFALNSPLLIANNVSLKADLRFVRGGQLWRCSETWPGFSVRNARLIYSIALFFLFYVAPLLIMSLLYCQLARFLLQHQKLTITATATATTATATAAASTGLSIGLSSTNKHTNKTAVTPITRASRTVCSSSVAAAAGDACSRPRFSRQVRLNQMSVKAGGGLDGFMKTLNSRLRVSKLIIMLVALFAICWLPYHAINIYVDATGNNNNNNNNSGGGAAGGGSGEAGEAVEAGGAPPINNNNNNKHNNDEDDEDDEDADSRQTNSRHIRRVRSRAWLELLYRLLQILGFSNSAINPFLTLCFSQKFRQCLRRLIGCGGADPRANPANSSIHHTHHHTHHHHAHGNHSHHHMGQLRKRQLSSVAGHLSSSWMGGSIDRNNLQLCLAAAAASAAYSPHSSHCHPCGGVGDDDVDGDEESCNRQALISVALPPPPHQRMGENDAISKVMIDDETGAAAVATGTANNNDDDDDVIMSSCDVDRTAAASSYGAAAIPFLHHHAAAAAHPFCSSSSPNKLHWQSSSSSSSTLT